jgi:hypothetical protein
MTNSTNPARVVVLARYRPTTSTTEGEAHLLSLPLRGDDGRRQVIGALCGKRLHIEHIETGRPRCRRGRGGAGHPRRTGH